MAITAQNASKNDDRTVRDSMSPAPRPPASSAPGPRASTLLKIYDDAINKVTKTCSYPNFSACFPTPAEYAPDSLRGLHRDFVNRLGEVCRSEFTALIEHRDVVRSLNELDELLAEAKRRKLKAEENSKGAPTEIPQPPHLLPPSSLVAAHLQPLLTAQMEQLEAQLAQSTTMNVALAEEVRQQRAEIERLVAGLENTVHDIEQAADLLRKSPEIREVQNELEYHATMSGS